MFTGFAALPVTTSFQKNYALQNPSLSLLTDQRDEIIATGPQPSNPAESAIVRTLAPGNYTAIVTG